MKRTLLIAGGTLGGLGAVLAVTPPQITSASSAVGSIPMGVPAGPVQDAVQAPVVVAPTPTPVSIREARHHEDNEDDDNYEKASASSIQNSIPVAPVQSATPTPVAPVPVPSAKSVNGSFTGSAVNVGYGTVQVKITVVNGKITDAQAVQAPNGRSDRWSKMSVPILRQQTLDAQSAQITGVSGASYTSSGWYTSLTSALKQAGL
jgi:uncharacterized protein with FMN-binding domain